MDDNAAIGERALLGNLLVAPARSVELREDERAAGVGFGGHGYSRMNAVRRLGEMDRDAMGFVTPAVGGTAPRMMVNYRTRR